MNLEQLLEQCGFLPKYQGFCALHECILVALEEKDNILYLTGIYQTVAKKLNISRISVERNIRTGIQYSWNHGGKEELEKIAGRTLHKKPCIGDLIDMFVFYIEMHPDQISLQV